MGWPARATANGIRTLPHRHRASSGIARRRNLGRGVYSRTAFNLFTEVTTTYAGHATWDSPGVINQRQKHWLSSPEA